MKIWMHLNVLITIELHHDQTCLCHASNKGPNKPVCLLSLIITFVVAVKKV